MANGMDFSHTTISNPPLLQFLTKGQVTKLISKITNRLSEPDVEIDELGGLLVQLQTKDEQLKSLDNKMFWIPRI
ncbi:hypothetical protein NPIL_432211 [Nephila pilipes]|uniref:Uncharacterized protein n=1 Tax=Nephila pilipes TaxID=299642 RepID=A0A8X6UNR5_NEPPI|nr:hypothetical protein NPIL_432211 [Nephila pilipes]